MSKKILFLASNYGLWGEELQAPWDACNEAGFETVVSTFTGKTPLPLDVSVQAGFVDPVQDVVMTPENVANRMEEILDDGEWEDPVKTGDVDMDNYDAIVITGGPGAGFDITGSVTVHNLVTEAYKSGKLVAAICAGVATLGYTRHPDKEGRSLVRGKEVAAHPRSWDFAFEMEYNLARATEENNGSTIVTPGFIIPVEWIMQDATGDPDLVHAVPDADRENPVVYYDKPILTAQSVASSVAFGEKLVEVMKEGDY